MFKQLIAVVALAALASLVVCQNEETQAEPQQQQQQQHHNKASKYTNGLLDLAIIAGKGAKRVVDDAKPTVKDLGKTIDEETQSLGKRLQDNVKGNKGLTDAWKKFSGNKHLEKVRQGFKPLAKNVHKHYEKLNEKMKPLIDRGMERAKPLLEQAKQKSHGLMADHEARQAKLREQKLQQQQETQQDEQ